jgi:hypothetical protein
MLGRQETHQHDLLTIHVVFNILMCSIQQSLDPRRVRDAKQIYPLQRATGPENLDQSLIFDLGLSRQLARRFVGIVMNAPGRAFTAVLESPGLGSACSHGKLGRFFHSKISKRGESVLVK